MLRQFFLCSKRHLYNFTYLSYEWFLFLKLNCKKPIWKGDLWNFLCRYSFTITSHKVICCLHYFWKKKYAHALKNRFCWIKNHLSGLIWKNSKIEGLKTGKYLVIICSFFCKIVILFFCNRLYFSMWNTKWFL